MTIESEKVIHPGDAGYIYVKLLNTGGGKEVYVRAFSQGLDIADRERRIRLAAGDQTVLVFSYSVKDVKAGFYELSVVYSYVDSKSGIFPDKSKREFSTKVSRVGTFTQKMERETTVRLLDDRLRLDSGEKVTLSFVADGDVRFVKYSINYDKTRAKITYDGSLQNFSGTKEEEIRVVPTSEGPIESEIEIFFMDALGELHSESLPLTLIPKSTQAIQNGVFAVLAAVTLLIAGRFALTSTKVRHKV